MKVLWLVNITLPEASKLIGEKISPFGGWLINSSKDLANKEDIELSIIFPSQKANEIEYAKGDKINYYFFKPIKDNDFKKINYNKSFERILNEIEPDLVHIYGTENPHTLSMVNMCNKLGIETLISIQGLVSVYAKHIYANLPLSAIYGFTLRNLLRKDSVYLHKKTFEIRGEKEKEAIRKVNHAIGRTTWDKACLQIINPNINYHFCNETLREEFYKHTWDIEKCEKHSIFLSQGQYSIKGLHYMLEAMPLVLKRFPDAKLYIGGKNIIKSKTIIDKSLMTYYARYIKTMISRLGIEKSVAFTGPLDEKNMCQKYLEANVFVCPSAIENSPNSLGEAMILGVPCVSSDVGGVSDMLEHLKEGYIYQADAPYMLAHYICDIFENSELAMNFSMEGRKKALKTHNRERNTTELLKIYSNILEKNKD